MRALSLQRTHDDAAVLRSQQCGRRLLHVGKHDPLARVFIKKHRSASRKYLGSIRVLDRDNGPRCRAGKGDPVLRYGRVWIQQRRLVRGDDEKVERLRCRVDYAQATGAFTAWPEKRARRQQQERE